MLLITAVITNASAVITSFRTPPPPDVLAAPPYGGVKNIAQSEGVQTGVGRFPAWRAGIWSGRPGTHSEPRCPDPAGPRLDNALQTLGTTASHLSGAGPAPEPTQRVALSARGEVTAWGLGTRMQGVETAAQLCSSSQRGGVPSPPT